MTARAAALLDHDDGEQFGRWLLAGAIVLAAHVGLMASYLLLRSAEPAGAPAAPAVIMDLAPLPVETASPMDVAPGPEMQEAAPPPEPVVDTPPPEPIIELPPPPPIIETPVVATPEPPPEVKPEPKREPPPPEVKKVERKKPAPRTTAAPRSERNTADRPAAPSPGAVASQASIANWRSMVIARLNAAKRGGVRNQGTVMVSFTVSRSGGVLGRSVTHSSGVAELDQEALAMIQRAAPYPAFPAAMTHASQHLTVPIRFFVR